jgi:hypothetical protein
MPHLETPLHYARARFSLKTDRIGTKNAACRGLGGTVIVTAYRAIIWNV